MESVIRALLIYVFLQIVVRLSGRRTLGELTPFDLVLLLIISEATQQALMSQDFSVTNAFIVITTLFGADIVLSKLKKVSPSMQKWMEGVPTLLVEHGNVLNEKLKSSRIEVEDILESARINHGIAKLSDIKYAILEKSGEISIIPK